jgi:hypothetical protein
MKLSPVALSCALIFSAAAVAAAAPATAADATVLGTYTFEAEDGESATWTLTPCADDTDNCVHVAETGSSSRAPWDANAYRSVGYWIIFVGQPDAVLCGDGATAPGINNYSWDAESLTGYASITDASGCGTAPENLAIPFALTRTGAGPVQYPTAPEQIEPYVVDIPEPYVPGAAEAPVPGAAEAPAAGAPVETDPALTAKPEIEAPAAGELTEAEVAEPGFNR